MKNRLLVASELLADDGIIAIQIDTSVNDKKESSESGYLQVLCDEIFDRDNFIGNITWHKKRGKDNSASFFSVTSEHILFYAKKKELVTIHRISLDEKTISAYKNPDNDQRGRYRELGMWSREQGGSEFEYTNNKGVVFPSRLWLCNLQTMQDLDADKRLIFKGDKVYKKFFLTENQGSIPETIWTDCSNTANAKDEIKALFGEVRFDTPKPEKLIQRIIEITTKPGDIVLDFFLGSGTTAAVSHKMGRQYIGVEQIDNTISTIIERLNKVISGEQGGVSKALDWQGSGSFVYCELMQLNAKYVDQIELTTSDKQLNTIMKNILSDGYITYKIDPEKFKSAFEQLEGIDDKKRALIDILDKNYLYVNYSEIDDTTNSVSKTDKVFNKQFYGEAK